MKSRRSIFVVFLVVVAAFILISQVVPALTAKDDHVDKLKVEFKLVAGSGKKVPSRQEFDTNPFGPYKTDDATKIPLLIDGGLAGHPDGGFTVHSGAYSDGDSFLPSAEASALVNVDLSGDADTLEFPAQERDLSGTYHGDGKASLKGVTTVSVKEAALQFVRGVPHSTLAYNRGGELLVLDGYSIWKLSADSKSLELQFYPPEDSTHSPEAIAVGPKGEVLFSSMVNLCRVSGLHSSEALAIPFGGYKCPGDPSDFRSKVIPVSFFAEALATDRQGNIYASYRNITKIDTKRNTQPVFAQRFESDSRYREDYSNKNSVSKAKLTDVLASRNIMGTRNFLVVNHSSGVLFVASARCLVRVLPDGNTARHCIAKDDDRRFDAERGIRALAIDGKGNLFVAIDNQVYEAQISE